MITTLLVLGPAGTGKTTLIRTLAGQHRRHLWHLVRLEPSEHGPCAPPALKPASPWSGLWHVCCPRQDVSAVLSDLVARIGDSADSQPVVIAFEAPPDSLLRHAYAYDLRAFVMPPLQDEAVMFRSPQEARQALRQIFLDSSAFTRQADPMDPPDADQTDPMASVLPVQTGQRVELSLTQVEAFLGRPLGVELAARVHQQPAFQATADADVIVLNTAAGPTFTEGNPCWQRLLALMSRLRAGGKDPPLICACDLTDPLDPSFVRVLRRMSKALCES